MAYSNTLLLERTLRTFIGVNNKQNNTIQIDADTVAVAQEPGKQILRGTFCWTLQGGENVRDKKTPFFRYQMR